MVADPTTDPLLAVRDLRTHYSVRGSFIDRLRGREAGAVAAVDGVSFDLRRGEVLGVVGESGSGKTTLGRTLLGLVPATGGSVHLRGREITGLPERELRPLRRRLQIVFQDPHASLNPAMTIGAAIADPLRFHGIAADAGDRKRRVAAALERVGLAPASQFADKYPTDLSGGQKQRAVLARAIVLGPEVLVADEPVSMLDMSVRAKILELMIALKEELDLTYLYITHDLATAKFFCDRIAIMYLGRIVEIGPASQIYDDPKHPYTASLLRAIPEPDPTRSVPRDLPRGEVPDAVSPPLGCRFHPRCPRAFEVCGWESRDLRTLLETRWTRMAEEEYERERELVGELDSLDEPAVEASLPAGPGHTDEEALGVLEAMRAEAPDDPFWKGVAELQPDGSGARVRFHEPLVPRDLEVDGARVECHLHDPEALAAARAAAASDGPAVVAEPT
ncbi:MAG: ATP-binding cassette domain-containing protein [Solirubrobacterales bacterium]|nr:ATP-binding cassette domain-containing protein [Solirubrobacterales bacterium]